MQALGFSINTLTLFGMVLAIGIVVDDAIVVVENVERHIGEGLSPKDAAKKAMEEVTGPVIAIVLVLCAVFVPVGFLGGITGELYKQFAITIAISVIISGIAALTLSPALCALVLKPGHSQRRGFFGVFNRFFDWTQARYTAVVGTILNRSVLSLVLFGIIGLFAVGLFKTIPASFLPEEDQGYFITIVQLPDGASKQRTDAVLSKIENYFLSVPAIHSTDALSGQNFVFGTRGPNAATMFVPLHHWDERKGPQNHVKALIGAAYGEFAKIPEALILAFNAPSIRGLGATGGFSVQLQDPSGGDFNKFAGVTQEFVAKARQHPAIGAIGTSFRVSAPTNLCPCGPRTSQIVGRADLRSVRYAASLFRQSLHQRLRQIRPCLSGANGSRSAISIHARGHRQDLRACREWTGIHHDSARYGGDDGIHERTGSGHPFQRIQHGPGLGSRGSGLQFRAGDSMRWIRWRRRC